MFTGIIQDVGFIHAIDSGTAGERRVAIRCPRMDLTRCVLGDSIAVAGICLTVIDLQSGVFAAEVSRETLAITTSGGWQVGLRVNLEYIARVHVACGDAVT